MFALPFLIISMVGTLASAAASAYAQHQQGEQMEANAKHDAQVKEMEAVEEENRRATESTEERKSSTRRLASLEAMYVKSGLLMAGTPTALIREQAEADEFNILSKDRASRIWAENRRTEGSMLLSQGKSAVSASRIGAGTTLLGGAASAASAYASYDLKMGSKTSVLENGMVQ